MNCDRHQVTPSNRQCVSRDHPRHLQCVEHHVRACVRRLASPRSSAKVRIDDEAHVGHPGPGGHERPICHPELVGRVAVNCRWTRSGCRAAAGSGLVVRTRFCRAEHPRCRRPASAARPGRGRRRGRPDGRFSTACGRRRRSNCLSRAGAKPAPARRRVGHADCGRVLAS